MKLPTFKFGTPEAMIGKAETSGATAAVMAVIYNVAIGGDWKAGGLSLLAVAVIYLAGFVTNTQPS